MAQAPKTDSAKYDRQLRLWGEQGQTALEMTKICLLNASATGTETLKNLVLPGVGSFTIVDATTTTEADFNNFFISEDSVGKPRAQVTVALLQELNDLVTGHAVIKSPSQLITQEPDFFKQFSIVVANNLPEQEVRQLAAICWSANIALVVLRAWGLIGYVRVAVPEHTIIESKPDNPPDDLRLSSPFPDLANFAASVNFDKMDSTEHSHTPFIFILLQCLEKWKAAHGGKLPEGSAEKKQFKDGILKGSRKAEEENFNEAYRSAHKAYAPVQIPSNTQAILNDPKAANPPADKFWILASALREFVAHEGAGKLPLMGSIPDMTSSTEGYINLQKLYQQQAAHDVAAVATRVGAILKTLGKPHDFISNDEVKLFCKNANFLGCIRYRSLEEEYSPKTSKSSFIASQLADKDSNLTWYVALRGADRFFNQQNRFPGSDDSKVKADVEGLKKCIAELFVELGIGSSTIDTKYIQEMVRYGAAELHPIAALIGGIASQEIIKLITHQYSPMDNTIIFNGLNSTSLTVSL